MVVLSTASPYKFPAAVLEAIGGDLSGTEFQQMHRLETITGVPIPKNLSSWKAKLNSTPASLRRTPCWSMF